MTHRRGSKSGPCWLPVRLRTGETHRRNSSIAAITCLVLDLDGLTREQAIEVGRRIDEDGIAAVMHSTHSHTDDAPCLRLAILPSREILPTEHARAWRAGCRRYGLDVADRQCGDLARLYYLPACPEGSDPIAVEFAGRPLDVDELIASEPEIEVPAPSVPASIPEWPTPENLEAAAHKLGAAWPSSHRHHAHLALSGALAQAGWPADAIASFAAMVAEVQQPGNGDEHKRLKTAHDTIAKLGSHLPSWGSLVNPHGISSEVLREVQGLLGVAMSTFEDERDDAFFDRLLLTARRSGPEPTEIDLDAVLDTAIKTRRSSKRPEVAAELEILRRIRNREAPWADDDTDEKCRLALLRAVILLVQVFADGERTCSVRPRQVETMTLSMSARFAPELPEIVTTAFEHVESKRARRSVIRSDFKRATVGPATGKPEANAQCNFDLALAKMEITLARDSFANRDLITYPDGRRETVQDDHVNNLRFDIDERFEFKPSKEELYDLVSNRAFRNSYHPVIDYLDGLPSWDGVTRVSGTDGPGWLTTYCGVLDSEYVREVGRIVLCAAVRRVRRPGCKFDEMLILEGPQGNNKSGLLQALCPNDDWYTDDFVLGQSTKELMEVTSGIWIVEAAELAGKRKAGADKLKAVMSRRKDRARMAYGRLLKEAPRQFIVIGTVNEAKYLQDLTGDRRYWPVLTGTIDVEGLKRDRDQLWAEANQLESENPDASYIRLAPALWEAAGIEQRKRAVGTRIEDRLRAAFGGHAADEDEGEVKPLVGKIALSEVLWLCGYDDVRPETADQRAAVIQVMTNMGWDLSNNALQVAVSSRVQGTRDRAFTRGTDAEKKVKLIVDTATRRVVPAPKRPSAR